MGASIRGLSASFTKGDLGLAPLQSLRGEGKEREALREGGENNAGFKSFKFGLEGL